MSKRARRSTSSFGGGGCILLAMNTFGAFRLSDSGLEHTQRQYQALHSGLLPHNDAYTRRIVENPTCTTPCSVRDQLIA